MDPLNPGFHNGGGQGGGSHSHDDDDDEKLRLISKEKTRPPRIDP